MTASNSDVHLRWNPTSALAGWLVPGLGHLLLGEKRRGIILLVTILALWVGGLLLGGVGVIDRQTHHYWFFGQVLVAPTLLIEMMQFSPGVPELAGGYQPSFAHMHEQGVLYTALAGLLNLLAILDVLYRDPRDPRYARRREQSAGESP